MLWEGKGEAREEKWCRNVAKESEKWRGCGGRGMNWWEASSPGSCAGAEFLLLAGEGVLLRTSVADKIQCGLLKLWGSSLL